MKKILFGALALLAVSTTAFAGGEDIYPGGFIEDCSYSLVEADPMAKIWTLTGNDLDKQKASKEYTAKCTCLSDKFFATSFNDVAYAYEVQMLMLQYHNRVNAPARLKLQFVRNADQCEAVSQKAKVDESIKKFDSEKKASGNPLKDSFMADIRGSLGKDLNGPNLRKADHISACVADRVTTFNKANPDLAELMTQRMHQNLKNGEPINVQGNKTVEMYIIQTYDNCW